MVQVILFEFKVFCPLFKRSMLGYDTTALGCSGCTFPVYPLMCASVTPWFRDLTHLMMEIFFNVNANSVNRTNK
ncbi:MAG TPA: hypothetical protein DIS90_08560 [Cytophagales bacterium]|nr:hypothetical protein [Cytophagales bacterium]